MRLQEEQKENPPSSIQLWFNHKTLLSYPALCSACQRRWEGLQMAVPVTLHPSLHPDCVQVVLKCKDQVKGGGIVCNNIV